jgi:4-amino-4-deoxy-L-arabinose transferase-like glycosyltransferase
MTPAGAGSAGCVLANRLDDATVRGLVLTARDLGPAEKAQARAFNLIPRARSSALRRRIIIDVYTAMFLGLTLLFFVLAETQPRRRRRWLLAMYAATGLGVLTKGPIAIVLPALVFLVYLVASRRLMTITRMAASPGRSRGDAREASATRSTRAADRPGISG